MSFVRTYDARIIEITEKGCFKEFDGVLYAFTDKDSAYRYENGKEVFKKADNIKELFDEFVFDTPEERDRMSWTYVCDNGTPRKEMMENMKYLESQKIKYKIYGAIWSPKGLIYIAEMDKRGNVVRLINNN